MNTISAEQVLILFGVAVVLIGGVLFYIFWDAARVAKHLPSKGGPPHKKLFAAVKTYEQGRYREAAEQWPELMKDFERAGNISGIITAANMTGQSFERLGEYEQAAEAYESAMSVAYREESADNLSLAHKRYAYCQLQLGHRAEAEKAFQKLAQIYRRLGYVDRSIETIVSLANTLREQGYLEQASAAYQEALELSRQLESSEGRALALHDQALFLQTMGKTHEALGCMQEATRIRLAGQDQELQSHMLTSLASVLRTLGRLAEAEEHYLRALDLARGAGSSRWVSMVELNGSLIAWAGGARDKAWDLLRRSTEAIDESSQDRRPVNAIIHAWYAEQSGDLSTAVATLEATETAFPKLKRQVEAALLNGKCRTLALWGRCEEAAAVLEKSRRLSQLLKAPAHVAEHALAAGMVWHCQGSHGEAALELAKALEFFQSSGFKRSVATVQKYRAAVLAALGQSAESTAAREEAKRIYLELGDTISAQEVQSFS